MKMKMINVFLGICLCTSFLNADKLADIKNKGVIKIGVQDNIPPFSFKNKNGKLVGFDIDMANYIAKELGVSSSFKKINSSQRVVSILNNNVDVVLAAMTHNKTRDKKIDFSISYFYNGQGIIGQRTSESQTYKDYAAKKVGVVSGTSYGKVFQVIQPLSQIVSYPNGKTALNALKKKEIAAITGEYSFILNTLKNNKGVFKSIGRPFTVDPYGVALKENESNLRDIINEIIQSSVKTGDYEKMYKKWFNRAPLRKPVLWP